MTVYQNEDQWDSSNVEFAAGQIIAYDKKVRTPAMRYIDYGLGVLRREAFDQVPRSGAYDLANVYQGLLKSGQLTGFEVHQRFYEAGSFTGIAELSEYLRGAVGLE